MKQKINIIFLMSIFVVKILFGIDYPQAGDDKPVEIYSYRITLTAGDKVGYSALTSPTVYGLVWFAGGITMAAGSGSVIFATPLYIDKQISLATGNVLELADDMFLADGVTLNASGKINAQYGKLLLTGVFDLQDKILTFTTGGPAYICGNGHVIDFSKGGQIVVADAVNTLYISNVYLKGLRKNSIIFNNKLDDLVINNCVLQMDGNVLFHNDVFMEGDILITGSGFSCCFNRYLGVGSGGNLIMDYGTTFSLGYPAEWYWDKVGNVFIWRGGIHFRGCNIEIGDNRGQSTHSGVYNNGFNVPHAKIIFEDEVLINDNSNNKSFTLGVSSDAIFLSGARVILEGTTTFSIY